MKFIVHNQSLVGWCGCQFLKDATYGTSVCRGKEAVASQECSAVHINIERYPVMCLGEGGGTRDVLHFGVDRRRKAVVSDPGADTLRSSFRRRSDHILIALSARSYFQRGAPRPIPRWYLCRLMGTSR